MPAAGRLADRTTPAARLRPLTQAPPDDRDGHVGPGRDVFPTRSGDIAERWPIGLSWHAIELAGAVDADDVSGP